MERPEEGPPEPPPGDWERTLREGEFSPALEPHRFGDEVDLGAEGSRGRREKIDRLFLCPHPGCGKEQKRGGQETDAEGLVTKFQCPGPDGHRWIFRRDPNNRNTGYIEDPDAPTLEFPRNKNRAAI